MIYAADLFVGVRWVEVVVVVVVRIGGGRGGGVREGGGEYPDSIRDEVAPPIHDPFYEGE